MGPTYARQVIQEQVWNHRHGLAVDMETLASQWEALDRALSAGGMGGLLPAPWHEAMLTSPIYRQQ